MSSGASTECQECFGAGMTIGPEGARRCQCEVKRILQERIQSGLARVPARYRSANLEALKPRPDLHPDQPQVILDIQQHPLDNFFLCGRGDVGKTHFFWALYQYVVRTGLPVYASALYDLVDSVKKAFAGGTIDPLRQVNENLERTPHMAVFLDDVNKARPTEFVAETVFNFVDRIYRNNHQLVVTSQLTPDELIEHFERVDPSYGLPIVRRMVNDETRIWRMF